MHEANNTTDKEIIATTREWLLQAVIGLNLCPFAKSVYVKEQIRYIVTRASNTDELTQCLRDELAYLHDADPDKTDTTLLIHPGVLTDFMDYNDYLDIVGDTLVDMDLEGILQVASFHPDYQFAGTDKDDISNYTNRSPYPILHLLREDSIARAAEAFPEASTIFEKNIRTMQQLGIEKWLALGFNVSRKQQ